MENAKSKIYVGMKAGRYDVFRTADITAAANPQYAGLIGPFKTWRAAAWMADMERGRTNPHCRTVADAERLAKKYKSEYNPRLKRWRPLPEGNIFWKHIEPSDLVTERPSLFIVNGTFVANWEGEDAAEAQTWLKNRAKADLIRAADLAEGNARPATVG